MTGTRDITGNQVAHGAGPATVPVDVAAPGAPAAVAAMRATIEARRTFEAMATQLAGRIPNSAGWERLMRPGTDVVAMLRAADEPQRQRIAAQITVAKGVLAAQLDYIAAQVAELRLLRAGDPTNTVHRYRLEQLVREFEQLERAYAMLGPALADDLAAPASAAIGASFERRPAPTGVAGTTNAVLRRLGVRDVDADPSTRSAQVLDRDLRRMEHALVVRGAQAGAAYEQNVLGKAELGGVVIDGHQVSPQELRRMTFERRRRVLEDERELDRRRVEAAARNDDWFGFDAEAAELAERAEEEQYQRWKHEREARERAADEAALERAYEERAWLDARIEEICFERKWEREHFEELALEAKQGDPWFDTDRLVWRGIELFVEQAWRVERANDQLEFATYLQRMAASRQAGEVESVGHAPASPELLAAKAAVAIATALAVSGSGAPSGQPGAGASAAGGSGAAA